MSGVNVTVVNVIVPVKDNVANVDVSLLSDADRERLAIPDSTSMLTAAELVERSVRAALAPLQLSLPAPRS